MPRMNGQNRAMLARVVQRCTSDSVRMTIVAADRRDTALLAAFLVEEARPAGKYSKHGGIPTVLFDNGSAVQVLSADEFRSMPDLGEDVEWEHKALEQAILYWQDTLDVASAALRHLRLRNPSLDLEKRVPDYSIKFHRGVEQPEFNKVMESIGFGKTPSGVEDEATSMPELINKEATRMAENGMKEGKLYKCAQADATRKLKELEERIMALPIQAVSEPTQEELLKGVDISPPVVNEADVRDAMAAAIEAHRKGNYPKLDPRMVQEPAGTPTHEDGVQALRERLSLLEKRLARDDALIGVYQATVEFRASIGAESLGEGTDLRRSGRTSRMLLRVHHGVLSRTLARKYVVVVQSVKEAKRLSDQLAGVAGAAKLDVILSSTGGVVQVAYPNGKSVLFLTAGQLNQHHVKKDAVVSWDHFALECEVRNLDDHISELSRRRLELVNMHRRMHYCLEVRSLDDHISELSRRRLELVNTHRKMHYRLEA